MIQNVLVFLFQVFCITIRDVYLYRYGLGHGEDVTSLCRFFGGGYVWWALRSNVIFYDENGIKESTTPRPPRVMYVRCVSALVA